jgi:hypothetical protein
MVSAMDLALAGVKTWHMTAQSAAVMGMRLAGMAGAWSMPASEYERMVTEKQAAFAEAGRRMAEALGRGAAPLAVYEAALVPVARETRANAERLSRHVLGG